MTASYDVKTGKLTIVLDTQTPTPSKSGGKNLIVATSHGYEATPVIIGGKPLIVSVNAFVRP